MSTARLFEPLRIRDLELKNRIAMSPLSMHSATARGEVTDFHHVHYAARALGGAGLIVVEAASVTNNGLLGAGDLGIWADFQVPGLTALVETIHAYGAHAGAQLGHTGRLNRIPGARLVAPSAIPFDASSPTPDALTVPEINELVAAYGAATVRAVHAGFDVIEIHAAHGYLLNEFLSPLANHRDDEYGGGLENRYRMLREVIAEVRSRWNGPLFVRISSTDYAEGGNTPDDYVVFSRWMKDQGVDLVDCSSGGIAPVKVDSYPNYQVPAAELIREETGLLTGAVGLIQSGRQAEELLRNGRADLILISREMLRDPFWARTAADDLRVRLTPPPQYTRYGTAWQRNVEPAPAAPLPEVS